jgi:excinuclease UvrABC ATPase subunit
VIVDRLVAKTSEEERYQFETRLKDSLSLAYQKGDGILSLYRIDTEEFYEYHEDPACPICGFAQKELTLSNFSFNSHH